MIERISGLRKRIQPYGKRGATVGGAAVVAGALVVGVLFGDGVANTVVDTSDGTTWVGDDLHGDVVQVNPTTGKPESRVNVGAPNSDLEVRQRDGLLVVIDRKSGVVTLIDLATLLTTGRRQVSPGDGVEALLFGDRTLLVDRDKGTITNVDSKSADTIGQEWRAEPGLADAGIDRAGVVWALDRETNLHKLTWSEDLDRFVEEGTRPVDGTGPESVLVSHDQGVTVLGPEGGVAVQVETGTDRAIAVPGLATPLHAADVSPADLVPVAVEETGAVLVLRGDEMLEIGVGGVGCERPGEPAVLNRLVYVPCLGARKVIVLDENGRSARPDIITPEGGDPELAVDDAQIIVTAPGAETGIVIESDGSTRTVTVNGPGGIADPNVPTTTTPPQDLRGDNAGTGPDDLPRGDRGNNNPAGPAQSATTQLDPPTPDEVLPTNVTAAARADGSVLVSWTPGPKKPNRFNVFFQPAAAGARATLVAQAPGTARSAVVTAVTPGSVGAFFVVGVPPGYQQGQDLPNSPLSAEVTIFARPGPVANIQLTGVTLPGGFNFNATQFTARVRWNAAADNGDAVTKYVVTVQTTTVQTFEPTGTEIKVTARCATARCVKQRVVVKVVAVNGAGSSAPITFETVLFS